MCPRVRDGPSGKASNRGQVLPLAVIVLSAGMLVLMPLLSQLATMLQRGGNEREQRMGVYAAEATLNRAIADLVRGADGVGTTYTTIRSGQPSQTYIITTAYTAPTVTVNDYTPTITISLPTPSQAKPSSQQNYVDPGVTHPQLGTVTAGYGFLMRLYNVKAGTIQVNWAYSPASRSRIGIWAGMPVDTRTNHPFPPGQIDLWPSDTPLYIHSTPASVTFNLTAPVSVNPDTDNSGGVYTIVFDNTLSPQTKTTAAFASTGGIGATWLYARAYKDYIVTASVGGISVSAYLRQVPGFSEPPGATFLGGNSFSFTWATNNVSFITNEAYAYTWLSP